jgi:hypothetical protein
MNKLRVLTTRSLAIGLVIVILSVTAAFALGTRIGLANGTTDPSQMVSAGSPPPLAAQFTADQPQIRPGALSSQLSYYFIGGNTFTPGGNVAYARQVTGCVNQMPIGIPFSAPVHLPNGSQVVSITAYTYNNVSDATTSTAYFIINNAADSGGYTVSASSLPNTTGYQQITSSQNNPFIVDNQNWNLLVEWRKDLGTADSTLLSLCGVRVAYYAPLGSLYLPTIVK